MYIFNEPGLEVRGEPEILEELARLIRQSDAEGVLSDLAFSIETYVNDSICSMKEDTRK